MSTEAEANLALLLDRKDRQADRRQPRCWGISSDALAVGAIRRRRPRRHDYPSDPSDLAACERTYRMAPDHLRTFMALVLVDYRAHVEKRYPGATVKVRDYVDAEDAGADHPPHEGPAVTYVSEGGSFTAEQVADMAVRYVVGRRS